MDQPLFLSAREAAARLGVKLETLYAYVSRGLLRSVAVPGSRERHYRRDDIEGFRAARAGKEAAEASPDAAMPSIHSAISLIDGGRLYYRGQDAVRLSDTATLEEIAALLWDAEIVSAPVPPLRRPEVATSAWRKLDPIARCQIRLATMAAAMPPLSDFTRPALAAAGHGILLAMIGSLIDRHPAATAAHEQFANRWRLDRTGADLLRRCLVLIADHELNASTLTARCVASTGAPLASVVSAALCALSGPRHGGAATEVEACFHAEKNSGDALTAIASRLARGEQLPGIGQPLYPEGDPRAVAILYALSLILPQARRLVSYRPNVDFALASVTSSLDLPPGAALSLFVVGRTVGWVAHAIEQYETGELIRPRARYTGPRPDGRG